MRETLRMNRCGWYPVTSVLASGDVLVNLNLTYWRSIEPTEGSKEVQGKTGQQFQNKFNRKTASRENHNGRLMGDSE